ncbi:hypothetical protein OHS33_33240 [Streptomyces sp. NBC_00536]|uniref:hypothetical protein n=1 Tax=Streptomyces sp. NBC_00536 TaxID=2975769 RepID=UPI002E8203DB|nr:hypothetical protein [Streptomyces sp. NBC_00536]WUC82804.1 hypothetical protein OHS33_33240 [Streptomyces sp. NBC_00536]
MSFEEKRAWTMGLVAVAAYAVYLSLLLSRAGDGPLTEVAYVPLLLWSVGGSTGATIAVTIALGIASPRGGRRTDQRDREISRFGEHIGQSFVAIGAIAALLMAMADWDRFWIANAVYLAFVLSAVLGSAARIAAYRSGFQPW